MDHYLKVVAIIKTKTSERQVKLGTSCRVKVPAEGEGPLRSNQPLIPSVAAVRRCQYEPNVTVEAYTGNHAGRRGNRLPEA